MPRFLVLLLFIRALGATSVLFDPGTPATGPFPTDFLTTFDALQKTGIRMNLPLPDCTAQYTSCQETGLLEQLDGFSLRARVQVRFSGAVNTATLRDGIFLVALDNLTQDEPGIHKPGDRIAIDQVVWDPASNTAYGKPDGVLDQHRRYLLVVTDAVKDSTGAAITSDSGYLACLASLDAYCNRVAQAAGGITVAPQKIVAASVFTTMSATAWLEHARDILPFIPPQVSLASPQSTFSLADTASLTIHEQIAVRPSRFLDFSLPISTTLLAGVDRVVIGSYNSPNFLDADQSIRPAPTGPGFAVPASTNRIWFNAILPGTPKPPAGYPVVIFGHGFGDSRYGGPTAVSPTMARSGFAVIAINAVGHGFGPESTLTVVDKSGKSTTLDGGGRGLDLNGDGFIGSNEGCALISPVAFGLRDCFRQTAVDLMQLARVLRQGLDLDGDGTPDLDGGHMYYAGDSLGSLYGPIFTALEPDVRAAAFNVGGGSGFDIARWSPAYRSITTDALRVRQPSLLNTGNAYDEDNVLPGQPVKTVAVTGAVAIQNALENLEWLSMSGDPLAFAPHLKVSPLPRRTSRPALVQFAKADRTMPNPTSTALVRAGGWQSSTWWYRHDLALAKAPDLPLDPHPFLVLFVSLDGSGTVQLPGLAGLAISLDAQGQLAGFFGTDGASIPDPNVLVNLALGIAVFEKPATLPQTLGF